MSQINTKHALKLDMTVEQIAQNLQSDDETSRKTALKLIKNAGQSGMSDISDYFRFAGRLDKQVAGKGVSALDVLYSNLGLPLTDDLDKGWSIKLANDVFAAYPGARLFFKSYVEDVIRYRARQNKTIDFRLFAMPERIIDAQEMYSKFITNDVIPGTNIGITDAAIKMYDIPQGAKIPVFSLNFSQQAIAMTKKGVGIGITYEFTRNFGGNLVDLIATHTQMIYRQADIDATSAFTKLLINGDSVAPAAAVINQSSYNGQGTSANSVNGTISWEHLFKWILARAEANFPIDTVLVDYNSGFQWQKLFGNQGAMSGYALAAALKAAGIDIGDVSDQMLGGLTSLKPVLTTGLAPNTIIGLMKDETLQPLRQSGADLVEDEKTVSNQTMTYYLSSITGGTILSPNSRTIFNYGA